MRRLTPSSTLFPYTTLFRSTGIGQLFGGHGERGRPEQRRERGRWRRLHRRRLHRRWLHRGPLLLRQFLRSEEHTSELQSQFHLVCRLLLEKKKKTNRQKKRI